MNNESTDRVINLGWGILLIGIGVVMIFGLRLGDWSHGNNLISRIWSPLTGIAVNLVGIYYVVKALRRVTEGGVMEVGLDNGSDSSSLIEIVLPMIVDPKERYTKFEIAIDEIIRTRKIGYVSGGGTPTQIDGNPFNGSTIDIKYYGDDLEYKNLLLELRTVLPKGTIVNYNETTFEI